MAKKKADVTSVDVKVRPATGDDDARVWLRANNYDDIANQIDSVMVAWRTAGKLTRRNWWEILAGHKDGTPRIAAGITFPVLRAARIRQGLPEIPGAICRDPNELAPPVRRSPRWPRKRRARRSAQ